MDQQEIKKNASTSENKALEKEKHKKNHFYEIVRFAIIGLLCTIIDLVVQMLILLALKNNLSTIPNWGRYASTAIAVTISFFVSMIVNFSFSRLWVFQNVEKGKNFKSAKYFWTYAGLGFGGFLLGLGLQELGVYICRSVWLLDLTLDPFAENVWQNLWNQGGMAFWAYIIVFCIKTCVTLIYNYTTRKLIIFKEPSKQKITEAAESSVNSTVINLTYSGKSETFGDKEKLHSNPVPAVVSSPSTSIPAPSEEAKNEEKVEEENTETLKLSNASSEPIETVYCKPQFNWGPTINKKSARDIIYSSLELYDPRKSSVVDVNHAKDMIVDEVYKQEKENKSKK